VDGIASFLNASDTQYLDVTLEVFDAVRVRPECPGMAARAFAVASWLGNALKLVDKVSDLEVRL